MHQQLVDRLTADGLAFRATTFPSFGDFCWDPDLTLEELFSFEPASCFDSSAGPARIVLQRIRGEIRYWLTSDRDPYAPIARAETELGRLETLDDAAALCRELLAGRVSVRDFRTPRIAGGIRRGDVRAAR